MKIKNAPPDNSGHPVGCPECFYGHPPSTFPDLPLTDEPGRVPADNGPGRNVLGDDGAGGNDAPFVKGDAGQDDGTGSDPDLILNDDGLGREFEDGAGDVVGGGAEEGVLRDDALGADANGVNSITVDVLPEPTVVAEFEFPRLPDATVGQDVAAFANLGTEAAKQEGAPTPEEVAARGRTEEAEPDDVPQGAFDLAALRVTVAVVLESDDGHGDIPFEGF